MNIRKRLTKREKEDIKLELTLIGREDLIENMSNLGDIYFIDRIWELYDGVYDLGKSGNTLYSLLTELGRDRDLLLNWRKYDVELMKYYNMGLRASRRSVREAIDFMKQEMASVIEWRRDEHGVMQMTSKKIDIKYLQEEEARFDNLITDEIDLVDDMIEIVANEDGDLNG